MRFDGTELLIRLLKPPLTTRGAGLFEPRLNLPKKPTQAPPNATRGQGQVKDARPWAKKSVNLLLHSCTCPLEKQNAWCRIVGWWVGVYFSSMVVWGEYLYVMPLGIKLRCSNQAYLESSSSRVAGWDLLLLK